MEYTCLERYVFSGLCGNSGHKVGGDEGPQDDRVLTRWKMRENISIKVNRNQHHRHLTHLLYAAYSNSFNTGP